MYVHTYKVHSILQLLILQSHPPSSDVTYLEKQRSAIDGRKFHQPAPWIPDIHASKPSTSDVCLPPYRPSQSQWANRVISSPQSQRPFISFISQLLIIHHTASPMVELSAPVLHLFVLGDTCHALRHKHKNEVPALSPYIGSQTPTTAAVIAAN